MNTINVVCIKTASSICFTGRMKPFFLVSQWEGRKAESVSYTHLDVYKRQPFSDGVWYDEKEGKYKMWYMAGGGSYATSGAGVTCYAESTDGIHLSLIHI